MSNGICTKMNGSKCAEEYCDFWNVESQKCNDALLKEKELELVKHIITLLNKDTEETNENRLKKLIGGMNLMPSSDLKQ